MSAQTMNFCVTFVGHGFGRGQKPKRMGPLRTMCLLLFNFFISDVGLLSRKERDAVSTILKRVVKDIFC